MKKPIFIIRYFWNQEPPKTLVQCFIAGSVSVLLTLIFALAAYYVIGLGVSEPAEPFPWQIMAFLFPFAFIAPFGMWWRNKSAQ